MAKRTEVTCRLCKSFLHSTEQHKKERIERERVSKEYWEGRKI